MWIHSKEGDEYTNNVLEGVMQIRCVTEKKKPIRDPTQKKRKNFRLSPIIEFTKQPKPNVKKEDSLGSSLT